MLQIMSKWIGINALHVLSIVLWLYILGTLMCHGRHFLKNGVHRGLSVFNLRSKVQFEGNFPCYHHLQWFTRGTVL